MYDQPEIPEDWPRNKFVRKRRINWLGSLVMFIYVCAFGFYCFVRPDLLPCQQQRAPSHALGKQPSTCTAFISHL